MSADLDGRRIKPNIDHERGGRWRVIPAANVSQYDIVYASGTSAGYMQVTKADADALATSRGTLFMCRHGATANGNDPLLEVNARMLVTGVDTSAGAVGDPVYLSGTAGGWTLTVGSSATQRIVGRVITVSASAGAWLFDGSTNSGRTIVSSTLDIANGTDTGTAAVGAIFNGRPVLATLNEADGTLSVASAVVAAGTLTVILTGNTTGIRTVGYTIF